MEPVTLRRYRSDDAAAVTQLFREVYAHHYVQPQVYLPRMITQNQTDGRWHSLLAVSADRVVGHAALIRDEGGRTAELALSVVHPDARGRSIATRLGRELLTQAEAMGYRGVTIKQVTRHPYTQRMAETLGFHGTALFADYAPSPVGDPEPESVVIGYRPLAGHRRPLPAQRWPHSSRRLMQHLCDVFGTDHRAEPWVGPAARLRLRGDRYDGVFEALDAELARQLIGLPERWRISLRLRLGQDFASDLQTLSQAGFVFCGVTPDDGSNGWLALFHRGVRQCALTLHCPYMQGLQDDLQRSARP
ncbi:MULTISPECIES: GNAT family N-acetyltransferase [unclassified Pseudomonas]|uniref:GNAT family N-acetyltransferase n=1 Tax=unclassified Pseudomonas TaxID=196821 RepID=UPI000A20016C|nr:MULTISPECIES: GNAT family N-acetyltransferase [unclassified Pseudomonas]